MYRSPLFSVIRLKFVAIKVSYIISGFSYLTPPKVDGYTGSQ